MIREKRLFAVAFVVCACSNEPVNAESHPDTSSDASDQETDWDATPNDALPEPPRDAGPRSCPWLEDAGPGVETGVAIQSFCDTTVANSPECPSERPLDGASCPRDGLACRYGVGASSLTLARCNTGKWTTYGGQCSGTCTALDGGTWSLPTAPSCGSAPDIACAEDDGITDLERATRRLRQFAECCGALNENAVVARFEDGCVRSLEIARRDVAADQFVGCLTNLVAGRRLACAPTSCVYLEWSTVK